MMDIVPRRAQVRLASRLVLPLVLVAALVFLAPAGLVRAQIDPQVRDRVVPVIVEIAIDIDATENGSTEGQYLPVGSGTIVSPDGLILTNWHVVDMTAHRDWTGTMTLEAGSRVEGNTAELWGGGIMNDHGGTATVEANDIVTDNHPDNCAPIWEEVPNCIG